MLKHLSVPCLLALALATGCATNRSVVVIPTREVANPTAGAVVTITRVTDRRTFELEPTDPSVPSLKDGAITDKAITSRAIARKRGGFGKALGDVLLAEGGSVEVLVKDSLTAALREAGYRVPGPGEPVPAGALPMEVDIDRFWCWFEPGFWFVTCNFKGSLDVTSPAVNGGKATVLVKTDKGFQMVTESDWINTAKIGSEALGAKLKESLKPAN